MVTDSCIEMVEESESINLATREQLELQLLQARIREAERGIREAEELIAAYAALNCKFPL